MRIIANWKMHGGLAESRAILASLNDFIHCNSSQLTKSHHLELVICPPFTLIPWWAEAIIKLNIRQSHLFLSLGAQNCAAYSDGAYTGEVSCAMLREFQCRYVIIGHGERRSVFAETNEDITKKIKLAWLHGLTPIVCVGSSSRDTAEAWQAIAHQLEAIEGKTSEDKLIIGYEPLWAIGHSSAASLQEITPIKAKITNYLENHGFNHTSIVYGGAVNEQNIVELVPLSNEGFLIGRASVQPQHFTRVLNRLIMR